VQGRLKNQSPSVELRTECAHCGRPISITFDGHLAYKVHDEGASPLIFEPQIDWSAFTEPNIINAY
jgi:hypothetical protein